MVLPRTRDAGDIRAVDSLHPENRKNAMGDVFCAQNDFLSEAVHTNCRALVCMISVPNVHNQHRTTFADLKAGRY